MTTRRKFLKILGGGTILAAAGAPKFAMTRAPTKALAPWQAATNYTEPRRRALAHALLAPNPHNRQPWLIELKGEDTVILHRDETRELPMTDPFNRQIFIGLGCFIEQMVIAASADGYAIDLTLFPDGETGPIAHAMFRKGATTNPLAAQILHRHCNKEAYEDRSVEADKAVALSDHATIITEGAKTAALRKLIWDALYVEITTPRTLRESVELMRIGKSEINANPDGIEMRGALFDAARRVGVLTNDLLMDTSHPAFQGEMERYQETFAATPAFAVVTTAGNTRFDQIEAGRRWLRLNLKTTELGLGLHPCSQALQEFPEMAEHYATAHGLLAAPGETVQMLGRLGYGPEAQATPRWALETRMLNG